MIDVKQNFQDRVKDVIKKKKVEVSIYRINGDVDNFVVQEIDETDNDHVGDKVKEVGKVDITYRIDMENFQELKKVTEEDDDQKVKDHFEVEERENN